MFRGVFPQQKRLIWTLVEVKNPYGTPQSRCGMGLALDSKSKKIIVHGGDVSHPPIGAATFDCWQFSLPESKWSNKTIGAVSLGPKQRQPFARWGHTLTATTNSGCFLFGGSDAQKSRFGDLWCLDVEKNTWTEIQPSPTQNDDHHPSKRDLHSCTFVSGSNSLVVIGGRPIDDSPVAESKVWKLDLFNMKWSLLNSVGNDAPLLGLSGHLAVLDSTQRYIYCIGGWPAVINTMTKAVPTEKISSFVRYDLEHETWESLETPPFGHRAALVGGLLKNGKIIVGCGFTMDAGKPRWDMIDMWSYDIATQKWTKVTNGNSNTGPTGAVDARCVTDPESGTIYMFGGEGKHREVSNHLWKWV